MTDVRYPGLTLSGSYNDGPQLLGTRFNFTATTEIVGFYYYSPITQTADLAFYRVGAASALDTKLGVSLTVGNNFIPFSAPISVAANKTHVVIAKVSGYSTGAPGDAPGAPYVEGTFEGGQGSVDDALNTGRMSVLSTATSLPTAFSDSDLTNPNGYVMQLISNWTGPGVYLIEDVLTVDAGASFEIETNDIGTMTAVASNVTGTPTYAWSQVSGPTVSLSTPTSASTSFIPTVAGFYVFQIQVTDSEGSATDTVLVTVTEPPPDTVIPWVKEHGVWKKVAFGETSGSASEPHVFRVEDYGAAGDGVTDDTESIQSCIDAAFAAAPENNYNVVVQFQSKEYLIATPGVVGEEYGYAQLRVPFNSASVDGPKITMTFRGTGDNSQLPYWDQDVPVSAGTVLKSTWSGGDGGVASYGIAAVLGGPTYLMPASGAPQDDITTFSNMLVVVDGIQIQIPHGAVLGGFNFKRVAQMRIDTASVISNRVRNSSPSISILPSNDDSYGLITPSEGNNARNEIGSFMASGLSIGMIGQEHLSAHNLAFIYCRYGLVLSGSGNGQLWPDGTQKLITHHSWIGMLLCEAVSYWIWNLGSTGQLIISALGGEGITNFTEHLKDDNNLLTGEIHLADIYNKVPIVTGGKRIRFIADGVTRGHATAPSIPASTVALLNPFWRDAAINISGGTVTDILVDGSSTGLTSGTVVVGTGQTVALVYSAAPSWNWTLL